MSHARHGRKEARLLRVLAGSEREGSHGTAVKAAQKGDEARPAGDVARQLQGALDRLGAALAHEYLHRLAHRIELVDAFRQTCHALVPVIARDVQKIVGGALDRLHHRRVSMTGAAHRDAGGEIQKSIAVDIPDLRAASPGHDERIVARVGGRTHGTIACHQCPGLGSRQLSADVRRGHRQSSG